MKRILNDCNNNLNTLGKMSIHDLCQYNGVGPAKAITIMAVTLSSETVFNDDSMDKDSYDISYLKDHGNYTIYDIGFNGGAGLWFNHWIIDFSYQRGIASMFNNGNDFYSKKVQLSLGYAF